MGALKDDYKASRERPEHVKVKSLWLVAGGLALFTELPRGLPLR